MGRAERSGGGGLAGSAGGDCVSRGPWRRGAHLAWARDLATRQGVGPEEALLAEGLISRTSVLPRARRSARRSLLQRRPCAARVFRCQCGDSERASPASMRLKAGRALWSRRAASRCDFCSKSAMPRAKGCRLRSRRGSASAPFCALALARTSQDKRRTRLPNATRRSRLGRRDAGPACGDPGRAGLRRLRRQPRADSVARRAFARRSGRCSPPRCGCAPSRSPRAILRDRPRASAKLSCRSSPSSRPLHREAAVAADLVGRARRARLSARQARHKAGRRARRLGDARRARRACACRRATTSSSRRAVAPTTKPRALNIALGVARGSLLVVYDAEDRPAQDQLRLAAERFAADPTLDCLQARLIDRQRRRFLAHKDVRGRICDAVRSRQSRPRRARLPIALGGTSESFPRPALRDGGGWDAWNVTEDADLGMRLAR